jgi:hypothetical protein
MNPEMKFPEEEKVAVERELASVMHGTAKA